MSGNIKGITIEFRGDTTKLDKALRTIQKESNRTQRELTSINKALKFNPGSVDLWRQKQTVLTQKVKETEEKLSALKQAQKNMDAAQVDKNSEEYRKLQREIIETESKLKTFKAQLREVGNYKLKALSESLKDIGSKATDVGKKLTKNVTAPIAAAYGAAIKASLNYGDAMAKVATIADQEKKSVKDLSSEILALSNESGKGASELAEATYQALSASVDTEHVVDFVRQSAGLAKAGFLETADAVDVLTTIINAYGFETEKADEIANQLIQTQNDGKTTVNELASNMGQIIPTASALNVPLEQLNASYVLLTKQGINTANSTTYLRAMLNELSKDGSGVSKILKDETGKSFGELMADGYSLGDVMQILSDKVDGNGEAFKNLWSNTRAGQGALALLNGGVSEFNEEVVKMQNSTGNVSDALNELATPGAAARKALNKLINVGIQIGDVLAPYIEKAASFVQSLTEKFNSLSPETQAIIVKIGLLVAAIGPVILVIGKLMTVVGTVISIVNSAGAAIGMLASPIGIAIAAIAAIVAIGIVLYKNWDTIKAKATEFKNNVIATFNSFKASVSATFNAIKTAIVTPIQNAIDTIRSIIQRIKNFFPISIGKVMSNLKLPHFKLTGKFDLKTLSVPHLSVDWYAQGGIFNSPTIAGLGEIPGGEAVVPLNKFWDKLDNIAASTGDQIVINVYASPGMDINQLASEIQRRLAIVQKQKQVAYGGI